MFAKDEQSAFNRIIEFNEKYDFKYGFVFRFCVLTGQLCDEPEDRYKILWAFNLQKLGWQPNRMEI